MQNSGAMAILVVIIVVFVILVTCGCLFGPGLASTTARKVRRARRNRWRSSARAMMRNLGTEMNQSGVSMNSKSVNKQGGWRRGFEEYVDLRHPVGQLQPSTYGASGNVERDLRHPLGMGGSGSEEYVDLRHRSAKCAERRQHELNRSTSRAGLVPGLPKSTWTCATRSAKCSRAALA